MKQLHVFIAREKNSQTLPLREQLNRLGHRIVAEVQDSSAVLQRIAETTPDVVLVPHQFVAHLPLNRLPPVIVLATHDDPAIVEQLQASGATGFLLTPSSDSQLAWALTTATTPPLVPENSRKNARHAPNPGLGSGSTALGSKNYLQDRVRDIFQENPQEMDAALSMPAVVSPQSLNYTPDLGQLLELTLEQLAQVVTYDTAAVMLVQGAELKVVAGRGFSDPEQILGITFDIKENALFRVVQETGVPLILEDAQKDERFTSRGGTNYIRGWMGIPMLVKDRVIGYLTLDSLQPGAFSARDATLGQAFAIQAAVALQNAQLLAIQRIQAQRQAALSRISAELTASLDETEICRRVVNGLHDILGYKYVGLLLLDESSGARVLVAKVGWPNVPLNARIPPGQGTCEKPLLDGQLQYIPDVSQDPRYSRGLEGSEVDVPLQLEEKVLGVLVVESQRTHAFDQDDFELLTTVANQTATAIDKARLLTAERRRADQMEALRATVAAISTELNLPKLLQAVLERAVLLLGATGGELGLFIEEAQEIEIVASHHMDREKIGVRQALGQGAMGYVAETRRSVIIQDYKTWEHCLPQYAQGPWQAAIAAPLIVHERLVGSIGIVDLDPQRQFQPSDLRLLDLFAQQAAIAVENARLFQETQAALTKTQALYQVSRSLIAFDDLTEPLQSVVDNVAQTLSADRVTLITVEETAQQVTRFVKGGPGSAQVQRIDYKELWQGLSGWVLRELEPALSPKNIPDPRESEQARELRQATDCGAIIVVPLIYRDEILGTMTAINRLDQRDFEQQDVELMVTLANQAAVALENARLFISTRRQAEQLEALRQVSQDLMALQDLDTLLHQIVEQALQLMNGQAGGIYLFRPEQQTLEWVVAVGEHVAPLGTMLKRGEGLSGLVWETGDPIIVDDYSSWSGQAASWAGLKGSVLGIPIQWGNDFLGVINIRSSTNRDPFTMQDAKLLSQLTTQAAIAIHNARLHEAKRQQADELARLHRASSTLFFSATTDLPTLAQNIVEAVLREFGQANCSLLLLDETSGELERIGVAGPYVSQVTRGRLSLSGPGLVPRAMRTGKIVNVPNVRQEPDYVAHWDQARSELAVPLQVGERIIGALDVQSTCLDAFGRADERLLTAFAERAALALENARLHRETLRRADEITSLYEIGLATVSSLSLDEVLAAIYEQCQAVLPSETFYVALHRPGERYITCPMYIHRGKTINVEPQDFETGESFTHYIIQKRQPLIFDIPSALEGKGPVRPIKVADESPDTYLGVPLILRDQVIGVLSVQSSAPEAYSQAHVRLLTTIANQAAIAIENARLYQDSQRRQAEAIALYEATLPIPLLNLSSVLETLAQRATALTNLPRCIISLIEPEKVKMTIKAVQGYSKDRARKLIDQSFDPRDSASLWEKVFVAQQPYVSPDTQLDRRRELTRTAIDDSAQALLVVPLIAGERLIGTLQLTGEPRPLPQQLVRQVETFSTQAAITIENARLYNAVQEHARSLQVASWEKEQLLEQVQHYAETLEQQVAARTAQIFAEKEKVEAILKSAGDAIIITDVQSQIGYVNDAFTTLTGYSEAEMAGRQALEILFAGRTPPATVAAMQQTTNQGDTWRGDIYVTHKKGHELECDLTLAPICGEQGQVISLVGSLRDVTQIRALERAKAEFLTNVSHQLRTPVTNLKTYAFLLGKGPSEKQEQYLRVMEIEVEKLSLLVQDLLEIADLDAGPIIPEWTTISLEEIIDATTTRYQSLVKEAGLTLQIESPTRALPPVMGSKHRLAQALNQIVENALLYTPEGKITVGARLDDAPQAKVILWVSDTGPGISPEEQAQLFERFFRGRAAGPGHIVGTGLGLAITRMIVKAHGGRIEVYSKPGEGSRFEIRLPIADQCQPDSVS